MSCEIYAQARPARLAVVTRLARAPAQARAVLAFASLRRLCTAAALLLAAAQPAGAQTKIRLDAPTHAARRLDLSRLSSPYDAGQQLKTAGVARTSIDRSLPGETATASIGFLCGLQPSPETRGGAGALGVDPQGRFLGAQLRFGFR